jgi:hypothetical protein
MTNWITSGGPDARRRNGNETGNESLGREERLGRQLVQRCRTPLKVAGLALLIGLVSHISQARDRGQFGKVDPELKAWFEALKSGKGPCCSDADGTAISDADWETKDGHYRVRVEGEWVDVPEESVITEPNRVGRTMVWPIRGWGGLSIRCFMPGSMT